MDQLFSSDEDDELYGETKHDFVGKETPIDMNKLTEVDYVKLELEDANLTSRMKKARAELSTQEPIKSKNETGEVNFQRSITECSRSLDELKHLVLDIPSKALGTKSDLFALVDQITEYVKKIDKSITLARRNHDLAISSQ